jgi:hypothetical protein
MVSKKFCIGVEMSELSMKNVWLFILYGERPKEEEYETLEKIALENKELIMREMEELYSLVIRETESLLKKDESGYYGFSNFVYFIRDNHLSNMSPPTQRLYQKIRTMFGDFEFNLIRMKTSAEHYYKNSYEEYLKSTKETLRDSGRGTIWEPLKTLSALNLNILNSYRRSDERYVKPSSEIANELFEALHYELELSPQESQMVSNAHEFILALEDSFRLIGDKLKSLGKRTVSASLH